MTVESRPLVTLSDLHKAFAKWLYLRDYRLIDTIFATTLTYFLDGDPVWLLAYGASSFGKSTFANPLMGINDDRVERIIKLDDLSTKAFATGKKGAVDLGSRLQDSSHVVLIPDLATLMSMNKDDKGAIFGKLRTLYDGYIKRDTGDVSRKYEGCHVTFIMCATNMVKNEILLNAQLGTRELMYNAVDSFVSADERKNAQNEKMDKALTSINLKKQMTKELQQISHDFFISRIGKIQIGQLPDDMKDFIKREAIRLTYLRASVQMDFQTDQCLSDVVKEEPMRIVIQFKKIYHGLKALDDNYTDENIKTIISHIVDSTGKTERQKVLDAILKNPTDSVQSYILAKNLRISYRTVKQELETLWKMKLLEKETSQTTPPGRRYEVDVDNYYLNVDEARELLDLVKEKKGQQVLGCSK